MLAGTVWRILFFCFPCHNHSSNPFGFVPPLLEEGQSLPSLSPQLWPGLLPGIGQGRPRSLPSPSQRAGGVSWQDSVWPALSPNTAKDCPVRGWRCFLSPRSLKLVPTPNCPVSVCPEQQPRGAEGAEQSHPSAQGVGFCFLLLFRSSRCPPWPRSPAGEGGAGTAAALPWSVGECCLQQPALRWPGPGKAPRGRGSGREGAAPGIHECVRSASCLFHSAFLIKIWEKRGRGSERWAGQGWGGAEGARLTSLRMIHTGESVWMDSLMASRGPKDGSTSPSATPLENEPGGEST